LGQQFLCKMISNNISSLAKRSVSKFAKSHNNALLSRDSRDRRYLGRITTPLLNLIMTLITLVTNSSLSGRL
jgi:hypothetical protein